MESGSVAIRFAPLISSFLFNLFIGHLELRLFLLMLWKTIKSEDFPCHDESRQIYVKVLRIA